MSDVRCDPTCPVRQQQRHQTKPPLRLIDRQLADTDTMLSDVQLITDRHDPVSDTARPPIHTPQTALISRMQTPATDIGHRTALSDNPPLSRQQNTQRRPISHNEQPPRKPRLIACRVGAWRSRRTRRTSEKPARQCAASRIRADTAPARRLLRSPNTTNTTRPACDRDAWRSHRPDTSHATILPEDTQTQRNSEATTRTGR